MACSNSYHGSLSVANGHIFHRWIACRCSVYFKHIYKEYIHKLKCTEFSIVYRVFNIINPSGFAVKNTWGYTSTPPCNLMTGTRQLRLLMPVSLPNVCTQEVTACFILMVNRTCQPGALHSDAPGWVQRDGNHRPWNWDCRQGGP